MLDPVGLPRSLGRFAASWARTRGPLRPAPPPDRARWDLDRAARWRERTGWLLGANFLPSTASNQLELWQADTFDPATIDRELGWASSTLGMNAIRLFLHDLCWEVDGRRFLDRVDRVLDLAASHGIATLPVLFDGIWDPEPRPGPQRRPRPGIHNSTWVQGPGAAVLADRSRWPALRPYVDAVIGRFGDDERVVGWDLFNEPDSPNVAYARRDPPGKARLVADLLELVWEWVEAADPSQPTTVGVYLTVEGPAPWAASRVARIALERSDVVSFHCYAAAPALERTIDTLAARGRPLMCTEWLGRPTSPASLGTLLRDRGVDGFVWGLVDGRSQTRHPWTSYLRPAAADRPWFHDLLHADGRPYDDAEAALFRSLGARPGAPPRGRTQRRTPDPTRVRVLSQDVADALGAQPTVPEPGLGG